MQDAGRRMPPMLEDRGRMRRRKIQDHPLASRAEAAEMDLVSGELEPDAAAAVQCPRTSWLLLVTMPKGEDKSGTRPAHQPYTVAPIFVINSPSFQLHHAWSCASKLLAWNPECQNSEDTACQKPHKPGVSQVGGASTRTHAECRNHHHHPLPSPFHLARVLS